MSALFSVGFRALFLGSALCAAIASTLWGLQLSGHTLFALTPGWHAHEMVFGFAGAMVGGFLLTAVPNWTKSTPVSGFPLILLTLLWTLGRFLPFVSTGFLQSFFAFCSALFLPGILLAVGLPIAKTGNRRNYGVLVIVWLLASLSVASLATNLGWWAYSPTKMANFAVLVLVVLVALIGGRITPFFTGNYFKKQGRNLELRGTQLRDHLAMGTLILTLLLWTFELSSLATGLFALVSAVLNASRMQKWGTGPSLKVPLLAILHFGYMWIVLALLLVALNAFMPAVFPKTTALHGFTLGVIGLYGIGMMSRVSLGHTGRPIVANKAAVLSFGLMGLAGAFRVFMPMVPAAAPYAWPIAAFSFALAYAIYIAVFSKALVLPRPDATVKIGKR